jgi:hypothetical protein
MPTHKVETIPFDASIKLDMPGSFYARLQQLLLSYSSSKSPQELQTILKKLGTDEEPEDEFEYHLFTLTIFIHEIEKKAKEQNLLKIEEVEIPDKSA